MSDLERELLDTRQRLARAEEALRVRTAFEAFLFDLSSTFIALPEDRVDADMQNGLARVGDFLQIDRITLLELTPNRNELLVAYSWSSPGVANAAPTNTTESLPWWMTHVLSGDVSLISRVDDLPAEAAAEKDYLRQRGVASAASIPLRVGGEIAGAITFITVHRHISWDAELVGQLRAIGDILWNALKRHQAMQARREAERAIRNSEERFRLIASTAPVMIWMSGVDQYVTYVNEAWMKLTGLPREAALGNPWPEIVHPDDLGRASETYVNACERREPFQMEYRLRRHDGEFRWIFLQGVPRYNAEQSFEGYIGSGIDVTDRKEAEQLLSTLSQRLIEAQEQERARVARELHDDISQRLALLLIDLEGAKQRVEAPRGQIAEELRRAIETGAALATDVQRLSRRLHASKLTVGLEAAARSFCREVSERSRVEVRFQTAGDIAHLPEEVSLCLYRVLQEALQNAVKHSGSPQVEVSLHGSASDVALSVCDAGIGFPIDEVLKGRRGLGLVSMKERLKLVLGELTIDSRPQHGTTIRACVPLVARSRDRMSYV
jgi:PAS domain S-box-containing protein